MERNEVGLYFAFGVWGFLVLGSVDLVWFSKEERLI
jgi:hypothetical protein